MRVTLTGILRLTSATLLTSLCALTSDVSSQEKITFDDHIKPIFQQRCATCHNGSKQSGGLDLTNYTNLMQGGGSGQSIEAGDAGSSYLFMLVTHEETPEMPPGGTKIPDASIKMLEQWINGGALENRGSVAKVKKKVAAAATINVGIRPEKIAFPWRMSLQPHFQADNGGVITAMAVSPWASVVALGAAKQILLYDTSTHGFLGALPFADGRANVLKFSPNGHLLLAAGGRQGLLGKVFIWDVGSTELVAELGEETDTILASDISADHYMVAWGGPQRMLRVIATNTQELLYEIKKHTDWITEIAFSPDGALLASGDKGGGLHIWEAESGNEYLSLAGHGRAITGLSWRGDGNILASCSDDGTIKLWEMERGGQVKSWSAHGGGVNSADFNRDGMLVSVGRDANAKLWDQDGKLVRQFPGLGEFGVSATYCDETKRIIAADFAGAVHVFNAVDAKPLAQLSTTPKTLEEQLQFAKSELSAAVEKAKPIQAQVVTLGEQLQTLQSQLNGAIANRDNTTAALESLQSNLGQTSGELDAAKQSRDQWQKELDESNESLPAVAQATESARSAASKLPGDAELQDLANKLQQKHDAIQSRIQTLDEHINQSLTGDELLASRLSATQSEIEDQNSALAEINESIQSLNTQIDPVAAQKSALDAELEKLTNQINGLQQRVEFWESEIEFDRMLAEKRLQLNAAKALVDEKETILADARQILAQTQADHDAKLSDRNQSLGEVQKREEELKSLRSRK